MNKIILNFIHKKLFNVNKQEFKNKNKIEN